MPGDDDLTMKQGGESGDENEQTEESGKKGGLFSNKLILFGGGGLATIIVGIALAMFVIKPMMSGADDEEPESDQTEKVVSEDGGGHDAEKESKHESTPKPKKKKHKKKNAHGEEESSVYSIKDIVINPAGTGGTRFLSVSIGFELETAELAHEFDAREPIVRDALITILSSKTVAQLTDPKQKEITRYQIKKRISKIMKTDELAGVYYTDFVLQ